MPARRRRDETDKPRRKPATTPEGRETELASLAHDLAEQQMRDGTASSQVITHFLKSGSTRESLEQRRLEREIALADAKIKELESRERIEELYKSAMDAMRSYTGSETHESD